MEKYGFIIIPEHSNDNSLNKNTTTSANKGEEIPLKTTEMTAQNKVDKND